MKKNLLLTGPPGCGKTTVLLRLKDRLSRSGLKIGGIACPEVREGGQRSGFQIIDLLGRKGILAHTSLYRTGGPIVSRYGINLGDLDGISREAFARKADVFIVDEIGPMELKSSVFSTEIQRILDSPVPVVAAIHFRTSWGFIGRVKARQDSRIITVDSRNRDLLPSELSEELLGTRR